MSPTPEQLQRYAEARNKAKREKRALERKEKLKQESEQRKAAARQFAEDQKAKRAEEKEERERQKKEEQAEKEKAKIGKAISPAAVEYLDLEAAKGSVQRTEARIRRIATAPMYNDPKEMIPIIEEFFDWCIMTQQLPLVTTLSLALGFATRKSLDDYIKKPEFADIIRRAKSVCEDAAARGLITGKNTIGFIFLLKQYGWKDVQESIHTVESHEQRIQRLIMQNGGR